MENGSAPLKALSKKHEMHIGYVAIKNRLARGSQEASWTSNEIIIVISISRWDSANNNIYKVISILSNCYFPRANWWKGYSHCRQDAPASEYLSYLQLAFGLRYAYNTFLNLSTHTRLCACKCIGLLKRLQDSSSVGS